ncbi:MAG TPA: ABC transporter permease, partial [Gemmatimonadaceae bacterium]|nr:ABC transporter permease [Gemmatimonadaceae bacterium]
MPHIPIWRRYLRFWRPDVAADVDDELRFHLDARSEALRALGHTPGDAARIAREEFGDVETTRQELRTIGERMERRRARASWWSHGRADLRFTLRGLRATPLFTLGVVLTLAIGLGAASTMYGTMRRLLQQPPPQVAAPEQLTRPYFHYAPPGGGEARAFNRFSYPFYERTRASLPARHALAAYEPGVPLVVGTGNDARQVRATLVSAGFWRTLGTRPLLGRFLTDEEAHPATGARAVVLGHAFWQRRFGGDTTVIGTTLHVRGEPYRVVGIAPRGFRGVELSDTDVWLPLFAATDVAERSPGWHTRGSSASVKYVLRTTPVTPVAQALAALTREHALLIREADPRQSLDALLGQPRTHVSLESVSRPIDARGRRLSAATVTIWLVGVAGLLLAIACANVASLLLLRALRRRREIAVRLALGMSRRRLAAMLLLESATLALLGGVGAGMLSIVGGAWVHRMLLPNMVSESAGVDWWTLAAAAAAVAIVALVTGLAPMSQTRRDVAAELRDGARHGATRRSRLHVGLLLTQTALSAVLLVGSGLFLRSLHRVTTMDLGLDATQTLVVQVGFTASSHSPREAAAFFEHVLASVRTMPGVQSASLATGAPLHEMSLMPVRTTPGGDVVRIANGLPMGNRVSDDFFESIGLQLVSGRAITAEDRTGPPVVVVNEALARLAWPGRSPLGECAYVGSDATSCARVVGVARNTHTARIRESQQLAVFASLPLDATDDRMLLVRVAPGARGMDATVGRVLRELDPTVLYVDAEWLGDALAPELRPWRLGAAVFTAFGILAALLAALG